MSSKKITTTVMKSPKKKSNKKKKNNSNSNQVKAASKSVTVSTVSTTMTTRKPKMTYKNDMIIIDHVEPIGTIIAKDGGDFTIAMDLDINPGDENAFPWLSTVAKAWEYYKVRKLNYHFLARTSTLTSGEVVMAPDYDINDQIPGSIEELTQNQDAVSSTAFKDFSCRLNPSSLMGGQQRKLVRGYVPRANFDQGRYDVGSFYVAISGIASSSGAYPLTIGRVYVEYCVELYVPVGNRTTQPITASVLSFSNAPNSSVQSIAANNGNVRVKPANIPISGLDSILAVDTPVPNAFQALQDTVLKVSGLDQYVASTTAGLLDNEHWFKKYNPATSAYDIPVGGASAVKTVSLNDQVDSTFDFVVPLKKGDSVLSYYDSTGGIANLLGGFSSLNFQDISRNFIA